MGDSYNSVEPLPNFTKNLKPLLHYVIYFSRARRYNVSMYKDKALQKETTRKRVARFRALHKGVTTKEGVTVTPVPSKEIPQIPSVFNVPKHLDPNYVFVGGTYVKKGG